MLTEIDARTDSEKRGIVRPRRVFLVAQLSRRVVRQDGRLRAPRRALRRAVV